MAELKTQPHDGDVMEFLSSVDSDRRREDAQVVLDLMQEVTGEEPKMWGTSIVGFGSYHYQYESGREGDWFVTGFSPRKHNLTLYIMSGFTQFEELLGQLGKYKTGKACLYINKIDDIDLNTLRKLIRLSVDHVAGKS